MFNQMFFYKHFPRLIFFINRTTGGGVEEEMKLLGLLCDKTKTSLDVGAKVGMFSYRLLPLSKKVIAFEPIPDLHQLIVKSMGKDQKLKIENYALSEKKGSSIIRIPIQSFGFPKYGRSTIEDANALPYDNIKSIQEITVKLEKLDDVVNEDIGFIKIDVEGHELSVLKGGKKTIAKYKPCFIIESQDMLYKGSVKKVASFLGKLGYDAYFIYQSKVDFAKNFSAEKHPGVLNFVYVHKSKNISLKDLQDYFDTQD